MLRRFSLWSLLIPLLIALIGAQASAQEEEAGEAALPTPSPEVTAPPEAERRAPAATPEEGTQTPEEGTQTPEEGTQTPEEDTQAPLEGTQTPEEGPGETGDEVTQEESPTEASMSAEELDSWLGGGGEATASAAPTGEAVSQAEPGFFENLTETDPAFALSRGGFHLGLIGSVQLLAVPWVDDPMASIEAGSIATTEGFRLRRARFGAEGGLPHNIGFRLLFQHGDGGANLLDANLSWEPHELARLTAGALKVPFSGIMMQSSEYQTFLQRPYAVRTISQDRALGFQISGRMFFFSYQAGIFNGGGDFYRGDNNAGMLYAVRFALHILGPPPAGQVTQPEGLILQLAGAYAFNQDATGNRHAANAELLLRWRRLTLRGEFLWDTFSPAEVPVTDEGIEYGHTTRMGWFAEAGVFIINEHLELALRYEGQRIEEGAFEVEDLNDLWALSAAVNGYFLQGRIKLSLQYEHRHEWFEDQVRNDWLAIQLQGRL